jgi:rRNA maturation endonuclease Nob1
MSDQLQQQFGEMAMKKFGVTQAELDRCLEFQRNIAQTEGRLMQLGEIMVNLRVLTPSQVRALVYNQDKIIVICERCGKRFNLDLDSASKKCPACGGTLSIVDALDPRLGVDGELKPEE